MNAHFICVAKLIDIMFAYGGQKILNALLKWSVTPPKRMSFVLCVHLRFTARFSFRNRLRDTAFLDKLTESLLQVNEACRFHIPNGWSPTPFPPTRQRIFKPAFTTVMDRARDRG